jgi:hypothetical protein
MRRAPTLIWVAWLLGLCLSSACSENKWNGGGDGGSDPGKDGGPSDLGGLPNTCPPGQELPSLKGTVLAPNGLDPITGALVYVARGPVAPLSPGNECDLCVLETSNAWVQTHTSTNGSFSFKKVPAGDIEVVIQLGKFRRVVPVKASCGGSVELTAEQSRLPRNETEGNIPKVAVATGNVDFMQYVLTKLGLEKYDLFEGKQTGPHPPFDLLVNDPTKLAAYNIVLINCSNADHDKNVLSGPGLKNLQEFVYSGGRLFVDDLSYEFVEWPFASGIDFEPDPTGAFLESAKPQEPFESAEVGKPGNGVDMPVVIDATCPKPDLLDWLKQFPGTVNPDNTVPIEGWLSHWAVMHAVPAGTSVWVKGVVSMYDGPTAERPLSASLDPVGPNGRRCGRVVFNSYHTVPNKASETAPFTPQERILEYLFFKVAGCPGLE